jgi:type I restriction enzyme, S subunit
MSNKLKKNVPVLRFPEFRGQKCNSYKLSNIACVERGKFTARPRNSPEYYGGNIPFVQTGDIKNSGGKISSYSQTLRDCL